MKGLSGSGMAMDGPGDGLGVDILKRSQLLCPFAVCSELYDADPAMQVTYLCWFKSQNFMDMSKGGAMNAYYAECEKTVDFKTCPIYQSAPEL